MGIARYATVIVLSIMFELLSVGFAHVCDDVSDDTVISYTQSTDVGCEQSSSYTVVIPKVITLDDSLAADFVVNASGDIAGDKALRVIPDTVVSMHDAHGKPDGTAYIDMPKTYFTWYELDNYNGRCAYGTATGEGMGAGDWTGVLNFNIYLMPALEPGAYNGNLDYVVSWEELGIDVTEKCIVYDDMTGDDNYYIKIPECGFNRLKYFPDVRWIVLPDGITEINDGVFFDCGQLEYIVLPNTVTVLHENAFRRCYHLRDVVMSDCITEIHHKAFASCRRLADVYIPAQAVFIEEEAFDDVRHITYYGELSDMLFGALKQN